MMRAKQVEQLELCISELSALFNSMDPTPFHHRDLDASAQEFLESWAMEFHHERAFNIIVYIEKMPLDDPTPLMTEAIHNYFSYKSLLLKRNLQHLLREGRTSLLIGLGFLALCLLGADLLASLSNLTNHTFLRVLKESLGIGGWVAMWRPMQIFLYDWWPLARRGRVYRNLSRANVQVLPAQSAFCNSVP